MRGTPKPDALLLFGRIARKHRFVLSEEIEECVAMAEKLRLMGVEKKIGEILSDQGYLTPEHVQWILQRQQLEEELMPDVSLFGDLAVLNGLTAPSELGRALKAQKKEARHGGARRIGEILVSEGRMRVADRDAILSLQRRVRAGTGSPVESAESPAFLLLETAAPKRSRALLALLVAALAVVAAGAVAAVLWLL